MRTLFVVVMAIVSAFAFAPMACAQEGEVCTIDTEFGGLREPAVAVNPLDPLNVVAASWGAWIRVSTDGGLNWTDAVEAIVPDGWDTGGDPTLTFDSNGRLYWSYLSNPPQEGTRMFIAEMDPVAGTYLGDPVQLEQFAPVGDDKSWILADVNPESPFLDRLYLVWWGLEVSHFVAVRYSDDHAATWSEPTILSVPDEGAAFPSHIAIAPNGDVFVSYHSQTGIDGPSQNPDGISGKVFVVRSIDGGDTWPQKNLAFQPGEADITWNVFLNPLGTIPGTRFILEGSNQSFIVTDPFVEGIIYVFAVDDPNNVHGDADDSHIYIARSTDSGVTWEPPVRVDHGPADTFQVFPTAAADPISGNVVVMWYDNRNLQFNGNGSYLLDVFFTVSTDQGLTFSDDRQLNDLPFDPDAGAPVDGSGRSWIGEYIGVAAGDGKLRGVWTGNTEGPGQQVFVGSDLLVEDVPPDDIVIGDFDGDGVVGTPDLFFMLGEWGDCTDCEDCIADLDGDCVVGSPDLLILLGEWS